MRKFGDVPEYVLSYVDYMSHLNEDNNTRVLFERALSSGQIQIEKTRMIWAKFLEFESHVGDLPSILKVEKRRLAAFEEVKEYQGKETALLIDRYRFLDLFPCSETELRALGYTVRVDLRALDHTVGIRWLDSASKIYSCVLLKLYFLIIFRI